MCKSYELEICGARDTTVYMHNMDNEVVKGLGLYLDFEHHVMGLQICILNACGRQHSFCEDGHK